MKQKNKMKLNTYFMVFILANVVGSVLLSMAILLILVKALEVKLDLSPTIWLILLCISISSAIISVLNRMIYEPVRKLNHAMNEVANGNFDVRMNDKSKVAELSDINRHFNHMAAQLAETEVLQTTFVSSVSHEIKTPINAVEGYAMLLQDSQCSEEERQLYVEKILYNTKRLSELTSNVLLLSKLDSDNIDNKVLDVQLDEQIRQMLMTLESAWEKKHIEFDVNLDNIRYRGYGNLLQHVWLNLIGNAIKFSDEKGKIRITLQREKKGILFQVQDYGCGISENARMHIFDRFYQEDSSHKEEGSGLGLALVKKIVDYHNGHITVESVQNEGSTFSVHLPRER